MRNLRLMTFNIAHGRGLSMYQGFHSLRGIHKNLQRIASVIREAQPDVVALQEVDESSHWNKHIHLLEYIREHTEYPYCTVGVHNRRRGRKPLAYGNAFLSRHPIEAAQTFPFGSKPLGEKGFMFANLLVENHTIPLLNVHLDYKSRSVRLDQVSKIAAFIRENHWDDPATPLSQPPIICGDFNSKRQSTRDAVQHLFNLLLRHGHYHLYPEKARTWPAHFPSVGLDFVFLPPDFACRECRVLTSYASDHRPVVLDFGFNG